MAAGRDPTTISIGSGTLYVAAIGTAEPTTLSGAWDAAFADVGYTESGIVFTQSMTTSAINVDEEFYRITTVVTDKAGTLAFSLSQFTATALQIASAGGTITTVAGQYVTFEPPLAGTENRVMLAWQSKNGDERFLWRQCFQTGNSATSRKKGTPQALLPVTFELEKPSGKLPWKWWGSMAGTVTMPNRSGA